MNTALYEAAGERIRRRRELLRLTRERLSEKAELSVQFIADIERGRKGFTVETLKKLCDALGVSADFVVYGKESGGGAGETARLLEAVGERHLPLAAGHIRLLLEALAEK